MSANVATFSSLGSDERATWRLVGSWVLLVPLLFFATKGGFLHPNDPSSLGDFTHDISSADATRDRIEQIGIWLICLAFMVPLARRIVGDLIEFKIIAAVPFLAILSAAWSPDPFESFRRAIYFSLTISFGIYLAERYKPTEQMRLFFFVGFAAAVLSVLAVLLLPRYALGFTGEWKGIFGHKNDLGVFMVFLLTPAFHLRGQFKFTRVVYILAGALLIYKSDSKTAWVLFLIYLVYVIAIRFLGRFERLDQTFLILVSVLIVTCLGLAIYQNLDMLTAGLGKNVTFSGRTRIWSAVMRSIWKQPLLGYGYGGFWRGFEGESGNLMTSVGFNVPHAHSGYLNIWLQLGAVGLCLFLAMLVKAIRNAFVCLTPNRPIWADWYFGVIILIVLSNLDESYIFNINEMTTVLCIMTYIGLSRLAHSRQEGSTVDPPYFPHGEPVVVE
jgi:exopolysaccharide production protein ExoQ